MFAQALLLALLVIVVLASTPIGVDPTEAEKFTESKFTCQNKSGQTITLDLSRINDDYCDCADGSDEPGTSACATAERRPTMFYCANKGFLPKRIFSAFVNDGICDCCDGSDENDGKTKCPNTCSVEGQGIKTKLQEQIDAIKNGLVIKQKYIAEAKAEMDLKKKISASKKEELAVVEKEQQEAILEKQRLEAIETQQKNDLKEKKRIEKEEAEKNAAQSEEAIETITVEPVAEGETPTETPAPTPAPTPEEDEEVKNYKTEEAEKARAVEREKTVSVDTIRLEIKHLDDVINFDHGPELEFYHLRGKTIEVPDRQYTYTHTVFDSVQQKENNGGSTSLGTFKEWEKNYTVMQYTGGQTCWQGPARSTTITLVCSGTDETKLFKVDEPSRCVYTMQMSTPAACKASDLEELERQLAPFL